MNSNLRRVADSEFESEIRIRGFTLIEVLMSVTLMAILSIILAGVLSNCRKTAAASETVADRLRTEMVLTEILQSELDFSTSPFSFEYSGDRLIGVAFASYGRFSGRDLRVRTRYVFEPDPDRPVYHLARYSIAEKIGVREQKEILVEGLRSCAIQGYSEAAGEFVSAEKLPDVPATVRLKFQLIQKWPKISGPEDQSPADEIQIILRNGHAVEPAS